MNTRDRIISHALDVCCNIHNAKKDFILNNKNRYSSTIKAKRMFIYYLYNYMEIKHNGMKKYFRNINHATSIHHVNKFGFEVETYAEVKQDFERFLLEMQKFNVYGAGFYEKRKELKRLLNEINDGLNTIKND